MNCEEKAEKITGIVLEFDQAKRKRPVKESVKRKMVKRTDGNDRWLEEEKPAERFPQFRPGYDNGLRGITEND
ncbi:hypothetical protein A2924_02445 [Candidatus Giovannonibacteria bacterium RIFCSPLOWO2_01_FULL_44_16]|uniref:Uncharacterized protein n=1 Tax=Candidatus Giovannonibacteria bacterium RIFCSPLOWO2_01_FULL_44_16 TaxID=1798348 RepID=A0A1F5X160_9BACT|nr:MAG: hypothetical protein A2924_02445 [Candidatus Giovannonibacteria bacterium RIFCSPLOWO2_01_FULL_44_16]